MSSTITLRVSDQEKELFQAFAKEEKRTLSDVARLALLEKVEDSYWSKRADVAYRKHLESPSPVSHAELMERYGIE